ncbi:MAG TPA: GNAT family N-acetyltransferase [Aquabacterium sp.]|nr:GNAT family N-acetyltransferase [Aquabacterium sp.]
MQWVECTFERHAEAILAIFNEAIVTSTALYDYAPRTLTTMRTWFDTKAAHGFPVIGVESETGELLGFASYGTFRAWPAYKYTVEHSVYIHREHRRRGLAHQLMQRLIERARAQDVHVLVGVIDASNAGSVALHHQLGFTHAGTVRQAGFKFGRWLDIDLYQLILDTPREPCDG